MKRMLIKALLMIMIITSFGGVAISGEYLGTLSSNPCDQNFTSNPYGAGNPYVRHTHRSSQQMHRYGTNRQNGVKIHTRCWCPETPSNYRSIQFPI
jgi:hypothetical protein